MKPQMFSLVKKLLGARGVHLFWAIYWYRQERKEKAELGFSSKIPIRGSERATLIEILLNGDEKSFLEVGFGYGQNLHALRELLGPENIYALELKEERIEATRPTLADLKFLQANIKNLPFESKSIDVVFTSAVLLYLKPEEIGEALRELIRVAKKRVVLLEQETLGEEQELSGGVVGGTYWVRNYQELLLSLDGVRTVNRYKIKNPRWPIESWEAMGVVLEIAVN